ncbi:MAG TPA: SDR family oxidoreductase [Nocardioides sp.]|nr:SDR family oxidoreductase [Nocardioides sp.]
MPDRPFAVITGASGGIGSQLARGFAAGDHDLVLQFRRDEDSVAELARELRTHGAHVEVLRADLTTPGGIAKVFAQVPDGRRLAVLVNNAGAYPSREFLDTTPRDWQDVMALNVIAPFECIRAAATRMHDGGSIINIASIAGHRAPADQAAYGASKAALLSLTRTAALALGDRGIRVNAVSPGLVRRQGIEQAWPDGVERWRRRSPLGRLVEPAQIAELCLFLAGPAATMITGQEYVIDGGVTVAEDY